MGLRVGVSSRGRMWVSGGPITGLFLGMFVLMFRLMWAMLQLSFWICVGMLWLFLVIARAEWHMFLAFMRAVRRARARQRDRDLSFGQALREEWELAREGSVRQVREVVERLKVGARARLMR